jgi:transposase-like protein
MTTDKRGLSALLLQRQLGIGRYETAWMILHKLRRAMINHAREPLWGEVELDETWVGGTQAGLRGSRQLKGRKAALVLAAVERRGRGTGRVRMEVIPDFTAATIREFAARNMRPGATIYTDGLKSFVGLAEAGYKHRPRTQPRPLELRQGVKSVVPLVFGSLRARRAPSNRCLVNIKREILNGLILHGSRSFPAPGLSQFQGSRKGRAFNVR